MDNTKFTRGAWLTLGLVIFLLVWGALGMLYFFSLPTDGWFVIATEEVDESSLVYQQNLLGAPSGLQSGDILIAVESFTEDLSSLQDRWQVGETINYTVARDGQELDVPVTLVRWEIGPALLYWIEQLGGVASGGVLLFFAIAALTFFKRPSDHAAQGLFLYAALFPALTPFIEVSQISTAVLATPLLNLMTIVTIFTAYSVLFPATLLHFGLVFPRPKPIVQRHPFLEYVPYVFGLLLIPLFLLEIYVAGYVWTAFSVIGTIALLAHSALTMRDSLSRAQLAWGLWGFVIGMLMFLSNYLQTFGLVSGVWADVGAVLSSLSFGVLGLTLSIAILRYRLFDIGIIVRRTLTYAIVTACLLLVFFGSVVLLQQAFEALTDYKQDEIVTVISTLAIAALFVPVRNRVQSVIDRRFNRKKYDAQQVLQDFSNTVRDETDLDHLASRLIQVVDETMQPTSVSVWLKKDKTPNAR